MRVSADRLYSRSAFGAGCGNLERVWKLVHCIDGRLGGGPSPRPSPGGRGGMNVVLPRSHRRTPRAEPLTPALSGGRGGESKYFRVEMADS